MNVYLQMLTEILNSGTLKGDRTGTGTRSIFGHQVRFDLSKGFPLVTTKKIHLKSVIAELLWFISGDTQVKTLQDQGVKIWDAWAPEDGELGPIYGHQWRNFGATRYVPTTSIDLVSGESNELPLYGDDGVDQLAEAVKLIKTNPDSRRIIVTGWNPAEATQVALPPCHTLFQFYVADGRLSCQLYQRSADVFLGVPFNIASYALLTHMVAQVTGLEVGDFVHTFGDLHLYNNHVEQAKLQINRSPKTLPTLVLNPDIKNLFDFKYEDIKVENYNHHPRIKAKVAV